MSPPREGDEVQAAKRYLSKVQMFLMRKNVPEREIAIFIKVWFNHIKIVFGNNLSNQLGTSSTPRRQETCP